MFAYDESALLEVLGVTPTTSDEYGRSFDFVLEDENVRCEFGFNADTGDVSLTLGVAGRDSKLFSGVILGSPGLHVVNEARAKYVEIAAPEARLDHLPLDGGIRLRPQPISVELIGV
jgi:hypothetical protein